MDDEALRAEIEKRVRERAELAWFARVNAPEPTEEEMQAANESWPESLTGVVAKDDWPEVEPLSEDAKESFIQSETERLFEVALVSRKAKEFHGPLTDDEWNDVCMDRVDFDVEAMLSQLKEGPSSPIRDALIDLIESGQEDSVSLRSVTSDEQLSEVSKRMAKRFEELTERIRNGEFRSGNETD